MCPQRNQVTTLNIIEMKLKWEIVNKDKSQYHMLVSEVGGVMAYIVPSDWDVVKNKKPTGELYYWSAWKSMNKESSGQCKTVDKCKAFIKDFFDEGFKID